MEHTNEMQLLLEKLEASNRKQLNYARMQFIFSAVSAVCCLVLVIAVISFLPRIVGITEQIEEITLQVHGLTTKAETVLSNLEIVTKKLTEVDLADMVSNVDALVTTSQDGVEQAIAKINNIDFGALNKAIANLSAVVEPLARFFKVLG